jgi:hypothetical protein
VEDHRESPCTQHGGESGTTGTASVVLVPVAVALMEGVASEKRIKIME